MFKLRWRNVSTNESGLVMMDKGSRRVVRTYKTNSSALNAAKKFKQFAPEEIEYEVVEA